MLKTNCVDGPISYGVWRLICISVALTAVTAFQVPALADEPPKDVMASMRPGGLRLQYSVFNADAGGRPVEFHLYEAPKASENIALERIDNRNAPNKPSLLYFLDVFMRNGPVLHRINTTFFTLPYRFRGSQDLKFKWLVPKARTGPILLISFGEPDGRSDNLVVFPKGIQREAYFQFFESGGEGDGEGNGYAFDTVDSHGQLVVTESVDFNSPPKHEVHKNYWTGDRFAQQGSRALPYFVIAASLPSQEAAEQFIRSHKLWDHAAIRNSSNFALLSPGHFIVLLGAAPSVTEGAATVKKLEKRDLNCYVKRAF